VCCGGTNATNETLNPTHGVSGRLVRILVQLLRSRPFADAMRGVLHAFRDHAGLGYPWKGIWAPPALAAVGVGGCTVRELILTTAAIALVVRPSATRGGSALPVSSAEDSRGAGGVQIAGQSHDVSDCVEMYQSGQDENGAFFWHQICCGSRL
jgi:hypothetical protein